jgi:three-Cys-motif partner protein
MPQRFGSAHTKSKLDKLEAYLRAFTTALKHQRFELIYFDAFAGTPDIDVGSADVPLLSAQDFRPLIQGSSRRALKFANFSKFIFVERKRANVSELVSLKREHSALSERIEIRHGDANVELQRFCGNWPRMRRAVVFLDPFGNQVTWDTLTRIAATRAIDLWYLFPAGLGVHRQIGKSGAAHADHHAASLDKLLGTPDWRAAFAETKETADLFGPTRQQRKTATPESITEFMIARMKRIFAGGVLDEWLPLGSEGRHSYSLIFACANPDPKANTLAMRLARAVLKSDKNGWA